MVFNEKLPGVPPSPETAEVASEVQRPAPSRTNSEKTPIVLEWFPIGSMVLPYMVCHESHQYTPVMLAYIPYMDPMGLEVVQILMQ